ncbi:cobaltochelatase CobT-related protein [Desulfonema magnum]|uniref:Cobalamin biosynthesis protein domain-containing protein n=1 Tax=Desulfonema magnum TaxID=45655 RepID=A0A975BSP5_9BACT|nr:hypothetical protein [Desulfonema magnum]QTA91099.1 Cobalamin biosynthesis protein domain-containing protein [Desulfonema magnum]
MKIRTAGIFFIGIVLVILLSGTMAGAGEVLVIANISVTADTLDRAAVSAIYLGDRTRWDSGGKIRVVMLRGGPTHERFTKDIVGTTPAKLRRFWKKIVFTGTGTPPKIFKKETDLVKFISNTEGAIGYIDASVSPVNVKVIAVRE